MSSGVQQLCSRWMLFRSCIGEQISRRKSIWLALRYGRVSYVAIVRFPRDVAYQTQPWSLLPQQVLGGAILMVDSCLFGKEK